MFIRILIFLLVLIISLILLSCIQNEIPLTLLTPADTSIFEIDSTLYEIEKYIVYEKILGITTYQFIILDSTASDWWIEDYPDYLPERINSIQQLKPETVQIYMEFNLKRYQIEPNFSDSLNYQLISPSRFDSIMTNGWWPYFYTLYPNTHEVYNFTNPGFDRKFSQCIVYMGYLVYGRAGGGKFMYLEKENNNWLIKYEIMVWVS